MNISWPGIKKYFAQRLVFFSREENRFSHSVFLNENGEWKEESSGEGMPSKEIFSFPKVLHARFAGVVPIEKAQVVEYKTTLQSKDKVLQVLPFELNKLIPYSSDDVVFDCLFARTEGEETVWNVVYLLKDVFDQEISFWQEKGIYLDVLEWEGDLQVEWLKQHAKEKIVFSSFSQAASTHFVLLRKNEILAQKIFLDPSKEQREKRVESVQKQWEKESPLSVDIPQKVQEYLASMSSLFLDGKKGLNFLSFRTKKEWFSSLLLKKAPGLSLLCLVASFLFVCAVGVQYWDLSYKIKSLKVEEKQAANEVKQKTGLTDKEVLAGPLKALFYPDRGSVLKTFLATSETLSSTVSLSYKGHRLQIDSDQFILEGETGSFADAESLERELSRSTSLKNVSLVRSEKNGRAVVFKIEADRVR